MISQLLSIRKDERRIVILLGGISFLMLAATTMIVTTSDALFVTVIGPEQLPYGIAIAQVTAIVGFYLYRICRRLLPTWLLNPTAVGLLVTGIAALYYFLQFESELAILAFVAIAPLYQSVLGAEYGRLSASLLDARSARRLLPILGAIGGLGATTGAYAVSVVSARWEALYVLPIIALAMLLLTLPAGMIRESKRPRVTSASATLGDVLRTRYALAMLAAGAIIVALSTLVRTQFGAMVKDNFTGDEIGVFYGQFNSILNITSVFVALFISRWVMQRAGAARTLFLYPGIVGAIAAVVAQIPVLLSTAAIQFFEKLVRQNLHNAASSIVSMPTKVGVRIRAAALSSGIVKPAAVLLTSGSLLATFGEGAIIPEPITWPHLSWPILALCLMLILLALYFRARYPRELSAALTARRLHLDEQDSLTDAEVPIDPALRKTLHGYLASDLEERIGLALELLKGRDNKETLQLVRQYWPSWAPWLKQKALSLMAESVDEVDTAFLQRVLPDEDDSVAAEIILLLAEGKSSDELWALFEDQSLGKNIRTTALSELSKREDPRVSRTFTDWSSSATTDDAQIFALSLSHWPTGDYDGALMDLLPKAPQATLQAMTNRPAPEFAPACIPYLGRDETFAHARSALLAVGEPSVPFLEKAAIDPNLPNSSFNVLSQIEGHQAHLAHMRLMAHASQIVRSRATKARLESIFELSPAEKKLVAENSEEALERAQRYTSYFQQSKGIVRSVAESEQEAAVEDVFLNLAMADTHTPYRQIHLALKSTDNKQRSFAIELLDEKLPKTIKRVLVPILDGEDLRTQFDMQADREWLELEQRLDQATTNNITLRQLKSTHLFAHWRVSELEFLSSLKGSEYGTPEVNVILRDGKPRELPKTLLTGKSPNPEQQDLALPLALIQHCLMQAPRCGQLWLQQLINEMPDQSAHAAEVTRSAMVSLASRTLGEDHNTAGAIDVWQRMFFLRSSTIGQDLPASRLKLLAEISKSITAPAGTVVVHEGRLGNHFYLVCSGSLELSFQGKTIDQLGHGDSFGALALLAGQRRPMTVRATSDSELIAISRIDFLDLIETHPALVRSFARSIANQVLMISANSS